MKRITVAATMAMFGAGLLCTSLLFTGCGPAEVKAEESGGITPRQFADGVHAVMMADRTVYATHVVTNLKKQDAPVTADEYWDDNDDTIPLPAQMFRMGAELVDDNPSAGFTYSLRSKWPLNEQHSAANEFEKKALEFLSEKRNLLAKSISLPSIQIALSRKLVGCATTSTNVAERTIQISKKMT